MSEQLKIAHIAASVDDPSAGPSYSIRGLAAAQKALGHEVFIRSLSGWRAATIKGGGSSLPLGSEVTRYPLDETWAGRRLGASRGLREAIEVDVRGFDIQHMHGLWLMPNIYPGRAQSRSFARAKLVAAPRGMLGEAALQFSNWRKRIVWQLMQKQAISSVGCLHATSEQELTDIRKFGLRNPVAIVPNGIDVPPQAERGVAKSAQRTVLSLGRIHPKKGLDNLVRAWGALEAKRPDWRLRIVGPSENGHADDLRRLVKAQALSRVTIEPPVFGAAKDSLLREAEIFALTTHNENFAMTVAEALAAGTPVISTKGAPWAGLVTHECGWWIEPDVASLIDALDHAMALPAGLLREMGARGRAWMIRDFSWKHAALEMTDVYLWLLGHAQRPSHVIAD